MRRPCLQVCNCPHKPFITSTYYPIGNLFVKSKNTKKQNRYVLVNSMQCDSSKQFKTKLVSDKNIPMLHHVEIVCDRFVWLLNSKKNGIQRASWLKSQRVGPKSPTCTSKNRKVCNQLIVMPLKATLIEDWFLSVAFSVLREKLSKRIACHGRSMQLTQDTFFVDLVSCIVFGMMLVSHRTWQIGNEMLR